MTINIEATIRWKGYNPNDLNPGSGKKIWANCDECGKGRWVSLKYHNKKPRFLCKSCGQKGIYPSEETRKKLSKIMTGKRTGDKNPLYGKHHSEETRKKISNSKKGVIAGKNHPMYGTHPSEKTRKKKSEAIIGKKHPFYGKHHSEQTRKKMSATHQGIYYNEWESFAREKPYCPAFNEACKESNRNKYDRRCFICGLPESENLTKTGKLKKLSVHHIDMNKQQGCDGNRWRLIPTCLHHHNLHNDLWMCRVIYLLNTCWNHSD